MNKVLPIILSVPHAGLEIPDTIKNLSILSEDQIRVDGDEGAEEIYAFEELSAFFFKTPIARAFVDLNRPPDDFSLDGVVKTHTCQMDPIYKQPLSAEQVKELLQQHYYPWHMKLTTASSTRGVLFGIDCHTMAETAPANTTDSGTRRPRVCLSNAGISCPDNWLEIIAEKFEHHFGAGSVSINQPFQGGFITRKLSKMCPWIQLELSRENFTNYKEKNRVVFDVINHFTDHVRLRNR